MTPDQMRAHLERHMQLMDSKEADCEGNTWTFGAPNFTVSACEHLIISLRDWKLFWENQANCSHEHGSGTMDTNGNGEFTCHECGHVQKIGRGLSGQPSGDGSGRENS